MKRNKPLFENRFDCRIAVTEYAPDLAAAIIHVKIGGYFRLWYGNLRELKNVVKRATLLTEGDYIESRSLPFEISNYEKLQFAETPPGITGAGTALAPDTKPGVNPKVNLTESSLKEASIDAEYEMILQALKESNYNKSKAAQLLKIDRKTLYNKMTLYEEMKN